MQNSNDVTISGLLTHTQSLINHVYWVKQEFEVEPNGEHIATAINFSDISERRSDFLKELINTISGWVYSKEKARKIIDDRLQQVEGSFLNASSFLTTQAFSKFRPGNPQGQFGELLLFNFIQYFFKAAPLLRKQRITTSVGHERYGADAIHYKKQDENNVIILGESKCYMSTYAFNKAFGVSLKSIENTFCNVNKELDLYIYDDFIEEELQEVARRYKNGTLDNVKFELVCVIAYNENLNISGSSENEIKQFILDAIRYRCENIDKSIYDSISNNVLQRINYIIFPIWKIDELLQSFQCHVGS